MTVGLIGGQSGDGQVQVPADDLGDVAERHARVAGP
jgi:hypothetical protein